MCCNFFWVEKFEILEDLGILLKIGVVVLFRLNKFNCFIFWFLFLFCVYFIIFFKFLINWWWFGLIWLKVLYLIKDFKVWLLRVLRLIWLYRLVKDLNFFCFFLVFKIVVIVFFFIFFIVDNLNKIWFFFFFVIIVGRGVKFIFDWLIFGGFIFILSLL